MFIQIMNRAMNEAIFQPLKAQPVVPRAPQGPAAKACGALRRRPHAGAAPAKTAPATLQIFASAFNTAVHGR